jgi:hypothetical protein
MASKSQLREVSKTPRGSIPSGVDIMRKFSDGLMQKPPSAFIESARMSITDNCDELIEIGARIRPLTVEGKQIGWVRGVHGSERRRLGRWLTDSNDYVVAILMLATTLTRAEILDLSSMELRNLVELVKKMTEFDLSLFPYMSAFTSTLVSENLWHGYGTKLTSFENKIVELPDGQTMKIVMPSDHARLWSTLCVYREQAKARLDASWNAVLQVRPMAGKSVDPLAKELKASGKLLMTNSLEPWEGIIKVQAEIDLDDGWAHAENLETRDGMMKELHGMLANDKHEQLMAKFEAQQLEAAEERRKAIELTSRRRGGLGINEETIRIESEADFRKREQELRKGRIAPTPIDRNKTETTKDPLDRMKRYQ